jgi:predicted RNA-binding Zn-ribbon protein involved in translation (DUF1610 family)
MKNTNQLCKCFARSGFIVAVATLVWLPGHALAQPKGAQLLMTHVTTPAQVEDLKSGDAVAMVCAKCKSVMVHNVTTEKGHIQVMTVGSKHLCPGCDSTITTVGSGKGAKQEVKHTCDKCGSDSVFCCATKPGAATPGMDKMEKN